MDLQQARNMLRINRHRLDDELEINAQVGEEIGREMAKRNSKQLDLKKSLDMVTAAEVARLKEDDPKLSNPAAEKEATRSREWRTAWNDYQAARHEHEEWEIVYKAWISRGFDLKALGELFAHQYFAMDSIRGPYPSKMDSIRSSMRERSREIETTSSDRPRRRSLVDS